jgi:hypothetical protein
LTSNTEIKQVCIQIAPCSSKYPHGLAEIGFYRVEGNFVQMVSEFGKPIGAKVPFDGDDHVRVAGRLTREAFEKQPRRSNFNRPLPGPGGPRVA